MLETLAIVQAGCRSEDSRRKITRKLGGKSVLEWVVRRATDCQRLDGVIVVTSDAPENRFLARLVPPDVPLFVSKAPDALGQFAAALEEYRTQAVVRIRALNPFIDPILIDQLVTTARGHSACDYVSYCLRDERPAILSPLGLFAEWFSVKALRRAARKATDPADRQDVTRYLYSHPEQFRVRLIPTPIPIDHNDVRAMADMEEHWEYAQTILEALGPEASDWQRIAGLLDRHLASRKQMAVGDRPHREGL